LKIEALCSFEMLETVSQSRQRTSQKTWILNIFLCTLSVKTLVPSRLRIGLRLVRQCQKALFAISTRHTLALYWVPGHAGVRGNEIADKLARGGSDQRFVGPEPFLGFSRRKIRKIKLWMENQHLVLWRGPCSIQREARELISGPELATWAWLLSFNGTQSRVVIGLLTGHNTLRRHLYIMGLSNNPTCRKCGTEEKTSVHIVCECEAFFLYTFIHNMLHYTVILHVLVFL
jgi:hypothetical protein